MDSRIRSGNLTLDDDGGFFVLKITHNSRSHFPNWKLARKFEKAIDNDSQQP